MWKATNECLPTDDRIRRVGVSITSACDRCVTRKYEDMDHILAKGEFAETLWRICSIHIGMPHTEGKSKKERVSCWHRRATNCSASGQLIDLVPSILIWQLWLRRCKVRMEGVHSSVTSI